MQYRYARYAGRRLLATANGTFERSNKTGSDIIAHYSARESVLSAVLPLLSIDYRYTCYVRRRLLALKNGGFARFSKIKHDMLAITAPIIVVSSNH